MKSLYNEIVLISVWCLIMLRLYFTIKYVINKYCYRVYPSPNNGRLQYV